MTITLDGVPLHKDMEWVDEFSYSPVTQSQTITLTGALIVESAAKLNGRHITLRGGDGACWVPRSTITALYALAQTAGLKMTLDYHGTPYTVVFRHTESPIEAAQVVRVMNPGADHKYTLSLKLMEVPA